MRYVAAIAPRPTDIYGHDRVLDAALAQGYPYPVKGEAKAKSTT